MQASGAENLVEADQRHWVETLSLHQFRNYENLKLTAAPGPIVLVGPNGAGKTNLLEAISLLSPGRGLRSAATSELAAFTGNGNFAISALVHGTGGTAQIGTGVNEDQIGETPPRRKVRIDGQTASSTAKLSEFVQVLWLTPAMDGLFTGPGAERRRFLDRLVTAFNPHVRKQLSQFERAMRQRNKLFEVETPFSAHHEGLEMQMAELGTAIAAARLETVERLRGVINDNMREGSVFPYATLALDGRLEIALETMAAVDVEDQYRQTLAASRARDKAAKRTLEGPHRTDLIVGHGPKAMPAKLCSTGEQKALLTGLVLAEARLVHDRAGGFSPILLLDEIAAHFDLSRRHALFDEIIALKAQAWMTGVDPDCFNYFGETAQIFGIEGAEIVA